MSDTDHEPVIDAASMLYTHANRKRALAIIDDEDGVAGIYTIAARLHMDTADAWRLLNDLMRRGWVQKPHAFYELTETGKSKLGRGPT